MTRTPRHWRRHGVSMNVRMFGWSLIIELVARTHLHLPITPHRRQAGKRPSWTGWQAREGGGLGRRRRAVREGDFECGAENRVHRATSR
jgi:hypothetical protein